MGAILMALTAVSVLICALSYWLMAVKAGGWGLRAYNFWGVGHEVKWNQIKVAEFKWFLLPYLVVSTDSGQRLWIALCLEEPLEFAQTVAQYTAPTHPLQQFLWQRGWLK